MKCVMMKNSTEYKWIVSIKRHLNKKLLNERMIYMELQFHRFFNTHEVYVVMDEKIYKLNSKDLSKEEVPEFPKGTRIKPIMSLQKAQFDIAKGFMFNIQNHFRISEADAEIYNQIGFISDEELKDYKDKLEREIVNNSKFASKED